MNKQPELSVPKQAKLDRIVAAAAAVLQQYWAEQSDREDKAITSIKEIVKNCVAIGYNDETKLGALDTHFQSMVQEVFNHARRRAELEAEKKVWEAGEEFREYRRLHGQLVWYCNLLIDTDLASPKAADLVEKIRKELDRKDTEETG